MREPERFEELRPLLFSIGYRMLGSVSEAEDVVQDAFLRFDRARREGAAIDSPKSWLSAVVTRLAIDALRSARVRRERYVGTWLPEPLVTDDAAADPAGQAELDESLSMAFLLVLERLGPTERAVFLLHDVFGYGHAEIAAIVGRSEVAVRQVAARARRRVRSERPRVERARVERPQVDSAPEERRSVAARLVAAMTAGDVGAVTRLLAPDVVVEGDGGGKAPQWTQPIEGIDRAARLLVGVGDQARALGLRFEPATVNAEPGAVVRDRDERVVNVFSFEVVDGLVRSVRSVINPDKLRHLGPVADVRALGRELGRRAREADSARPTTGRHGTR
ncbi:MAG TPA: RNA polymerase sigma-70 factor [Candidatus Limnocylindrales bacterium]|nr:RNA polymerase sigma-70 factor [Candidatus Limnocylindrales bacterium]